MTIPDQMIDLIFKGGQALILGAMGLGVKIFTGVKQDIMEIKIQLVGLDTTLRNHLSMADEKYEECRTMREELRTLLWDREGRKK